MQKTKLFITSMLCNALSACSPDVSQTNTQSAPPPTAEQASAVIEFDNQSPPSAPDYTLNSSWAALPEAPGKSLSRPQDAPPAVDSIKDVDVFYIHPTTFKSSVKWNQDIKDETVNSWTNESVIARQAGVFNECCQIYAPYYRQASFLATKDRLMEGDGGKAYDLAYSDVLRAFDDFIANRNQGRAFIIAGHSQGAEHSYRLLRDRIDGTPLRKKMVAAYVVGLDLMEGAFGREFQNLKICEKPTQFGCVMGWNAVTQEADLGFYEKMSGQRYANKFSTEEGRRGVCTNPLTFNADRPSAEKEAGKGAVSGTPGAGPMGPLVTQKVSATCKSGFLVTQYDPILDLDPLPGGSLHYHDFGLFYQNIKENASERIEAYNDAK